MLKAIAAAMIAPAAVGFQMSRLQVYQTRAERSSVTVLDGCSVRMECTVFFFSSSVVVVAVDLTSARAVGVDLT